jgi:glycerol-1-phosphate dehydrogenase [NAD(P)+]
MEHHTHKVQVPSHGFKVGIATLAITRLYEGLLTLDLTALEIERCLAEWPTADAAEARARTLFANTDFVETAATETRAKHISGTELRAQLDRLKCTWPDLRARLQAQLLPSAEMKRRLELVGAPVEPEEIGISRARLRETFFRAYHIRRRFTILDVAMRTGTLEPLLAGLFSSGAVWEIDGDKTQITGIP